MSQSQGKGQPISEHVLGEMHGKMDRTRQEWEDEVSKLKWEFFNLKPDERILTNHGSNDVLGTVDPSGVFFDSGMNRKKFRVTFDVSQYGPNEISVRTQDNKLYVYAKHEEVDKGKNISREFSRQIDIPKYVDPNTLKSILGKDGILEIEAPVITSNGHQGQGHPSRSNGMDPKVSPSRSLPPLSIPGWSSGSTSPGISSGVSSGISPGYSSGISPGFSPGLSPGMSSGRSSGSPSPGIRPGGAIHTEKDGSRKLKMMIEVGSEFSPEEVKVKTVDRKVRISAKHEEKKDSRTTKKEYNKELELPETVNPDLVTASMTLDGRLILEAPMTCYTPSGF